MNVDVPKFECEICDVQLDFALPSTSSCEAIMEMIIVKKRRRGEERFICLGMKKNIFFELPYWKCFEITT